MSSLRTMLALLALLCSASFVLGTPGCSSCQQQSFLAELVAQENSVERDFAKTQNQWNTAQSGERFRLGDGLRTGHAGQATLRLAQDGRLLVKGDTIVRFAQSVNTATAQPGFDVLQGELTVESGERPLAVHTSRGFVTVRKGSTVRVRTEQDATHFDVEVGRVEYMQNGARQVAQAGASFDLDILEVSVEAQAQKKAANAQTKPPLTAVADSTAPEPKNAARVRADEPLVFQDSPERALVSLVAGESATVHDPAPPTDVAVSFSSCQEQMVLEVDRDAGVLRYRGQGEARARLARGSHRYRVRCMQQGRALGPVVRSGQLKIAADSATRPLPLTPVTITADADGRRYTVSYQNLQPIITLRWPYAPRTNMYHLVVQPASGPQLSEDSAQATITLPPGRLGEGLHRFWFETADHKRSETGSLQVSFDYTARTAYLTSPRDAEALKDNSARFAGGTLLGSHVQVQGALMKLDSHGRFSATVTLAPEQDGAVVRVQHPSAGLHYYVRHLTR